MDQRTFQRAYGDGGAGVAPPPWEIDRPQPAIERLARSGALRGRVLDAGCGTGANAILLAELGHDVVAFDFVERAVAAATARADGALADDARARLRLVRADALALASAAEEERALAGPFDVVLDSGVLHTFDRDERARYAAEIAPRLAPGGRIVSLVFRDDEPGDHGPLRMTRAEVEDAFRPFAELESIEHARYVVRPEHDGTTFTAGGAHAWLAWWSRSS